MPRREGLRPIGDSVKKIIERIRKEREERQRKNKSVRTQPKLPGMKKGGGADASIPTVKELANFIKDKDVVSMADMERARKRLSTDTGRKNARYLMNKAKQRMERKKSDDKVRESLREISARGMARGGITKKDGGRKRLAPQSPIPTPDPQKPRPMPPRKKREDDRGLDKTKNQPKQDAGVEYDKTGPSRPGKNITGYAVKKGGLIGGQKKLDANKDGKISGDDFKILRGKQNKMKGGGIAIRGTNFKGVY